MGLGWSPRLSGKSIGPSWILSLQYYLQTPEGWSKHLFSLDATYRMRGAENCRVLWSAFNRIAKEFWKVTFVFQWAMACICTPKHVRVPVQMCPLQTIMNNWLVCVGFCTGSVLQARQTLASAWKCRLCFLEHNDSRLELAHVQAAWRVTERDKWWACGRKPLH